MYQQIILAKIISKLPLKQPAVLWLKGCYWKTNVHSFKIFPDTRIVLDCAELLVEKMACLTCHLITYSYYNCNYEYTLKILIRIDIRLNSKFAYSFNFSGIYISPNITLADSLFNQTSSIDLPIISSSTFWQLISIGQLSLGKEKPVLQKIPLWWRVSRPSSSR